MGQFEVRDGLLVVGDAATTRMAGPPEAMEQEQRLLELLGTEQAFVITGDGSRSVTARPWPSSYAPASSRCPRRADPGGPLGGRCDQT